LALGQSTSNIACTDVASLSATDYILSSTNACSLSFDGNGAATISLYGATGGKFAGKCVKAATRATVAVSTTC
jgi:hypothetical protein